MLRSRGTSGRHPEVRVGPHTLRPNGYVVERLGRLIKKSVLQPFPSAGRPTRPRLCALRNRGSSNGYRRKRSEPSEVSWGNVVGAMFCNDMRQTVWDQQLETNRPSHNVAG